MKKLALALLLAPSVAFAQAPPPESKTYTLAPAEVSALVQAINAAEFWYSVQEAYQGTGPSSSARAWGLMRQELDALKRKMAEQEKQQVKPPEKKP